MTKELREKYRQAINKVWESERMRDYCCSAADLVYEIAGKLLSVDKPRIETRFCFGHGYCGVSSMEDEQRASDMANHARTSEDYFKRENLKGIEWTISELEDNHRCAYITSAYRDSNSLAGLNFCYMADMELRQGNAEALGVYFHILTPEERQEAVKVYKLERERFTKRLNAYLKRYGLSKVHSWTYLSD